MTYVLSPVLRELGIGLGVRRLFYDIVHIYG